jgi:hypothetical protein
MSLGLYLRASDRENAWQVGLARRAEKGSLILYPPPEAPALGRSHRGRQPIADNLLIMLRCHESGSGTKRTSQLRWRMSAFGG